MTAPGGSRALHRLGVVVWLVALVALVFPVAAAAQDTEEPAAGGPQVRIKRVDTSDFPTVVADVSVTGTAAAADAINLTVDGNPLDPDSTSAVSSADRGVMFVLDASRSTEGQFGSGSRLDAMRAALVDLVGEIGGDRGLVVVSDHVDVVARLGALGPTTVGPRTADIEPVGTADIWEGVLAATLELRAATDLNPDVVIISDGPSAADSSSAQSAIATARQFSIGLHALAADNSELGGGFRSVATTTGGAYVAAGADGFQAATSTMSEQLAQQYRIEFEHPDAQANLAEFTVAVGEASAGAAVAPGTVVTGANVAPVVIPAESGGFFTGTAGKVVGLVLGLIAISLLAYGLGMLFFSGEQSLTATLSPYSDQPADEFDEDEDDQSAFVRRAIALTEDFAERQGLLPRVERLLEQAEMPLRPAEALFVYVLGIGFVFVVGALLAQTVVIGLLLALLAALIPVALVNRKAGKRRAAFQEQLPDTLQLLSGSLRAGYSFMQALETVAQETVEPMGTELRRVATEARLGRAAEDALDDVAERMESDDFGWAVMAIRIQREVGGNLAELLATVAETMVARERLRREVRALTAEGRISALILAILPVGMGVAIWLLNPDYIDTLFTDGRGQVAMLVAAVMIGLGFVWMNKIIEIDI